MATEREQLEQAITAQEGLRGTLSDAVVDAAIAALREKLASLDVQGKPSAGQQRKQVTVLFADVSGFTSIANGMDAEDVNDLINTLWQQLDAVISEQGGQIDKHIGDAVMALWGASEAREDDPARAIRAALLMQQALREYVRKDRRIGKEDPILMRIGINTGPVLLGAVGTRGEFSAIGDAVNVAKRLEESAPVGGVLVSHDTYRHVRGIFTVQPLDPIVVKGKPDPLTVYVVHAEKPRAFRTMTRGVEGIETRMIGRDAELKRLQKLFEKTIKNTKTQAITIVGDAGVGKSRLMYEFSNWIELRPERVRLFRGRATQEMASLPYGLIRSVLAFRFEIQDSDSAAAARDKVEKGIVEFLGDDEAARIKAMFVGHLVGYDFSARPELQGQLNDATRFRDRALTYITDLFRAVTKDRPCLLFLEDLHWADEPSLNVIDRLIKEAPDLPLLIVGLARPVLFERRPTWGKGQRVRLRLDLQPLSASDSRKLVEEILQKVRDLPASLRDLIVTGAEGNPFYLEELTKMLIEDGVILKGEDEWTVQAAKITEVRVPPTLTGVLQARLDALPTTERATLQKASVIGRIFWDMAVAQLETADEHLQQDTALSLKTLAHRELIFRRQESSFTDAQEFIFKHAILRDVTYESVLKRLRRVYHIQIAKWLEEQSSDRLSEYISLIAEHYERAGDIRQAVEYLIRAGDQASRIAELGEAVGLFQHALELTTAESDSELKRQRAIILSMLADNHWLLGRYEDSRRFGTESLTLARELGDVALISNALSLLARVEWVAGDMDHAERLIGEGLELARSSGNQSSISEALRQLCIIHLIRNNFERAVSYAQQSVEVARQCGDRQREALGLNMLGYSLVRKGDVGAALPHLHEGLKVAQEIKAAGVAAVINDSLGEAYFLQENYDAALEEFLKALKSNLSRNMLSLASSNVAHVAMVIQQKGEQERAVELATLAHNNPFSDSQVRGFSGPLLDRLGTILPKKVFDAAAKRGRKLDLEATCRELLASSR